MLDAPGRNRAEEVAMEWLADCRFLDEQVDSLGEAWADAAEYTREISPRKETQQLRAPRMVFYAAASGALEAAPKSCSYGHFEAMMETRWLVFTHGYVLPYLRPLRRPVFSPEAVQNEMSAIVEHQHGYWQAGARAALLCLRAGCASTTLEAEIAAAQRGRSAACGGGKNTMRTVRVGNGRECEIPTDWKKLRSWRHQPHPRGCRI
jgi:hypothetical protein